MSLALAIIVVAVTAATSIAVLAMFIWGAVKDGQDEARARLARLGQLPLAPPRAPCAGGPAPPQPLRRDALETYRLGAGDDPCHSTQMLLGMTALTWLILVPAVGCWPAAGYLVYLVNRSGKRHEEREATSASGCSSAHATRSGGAPRRPNATSTG